MNSQHSPVRAEWPLATSRRIAAIALAAGAILAAAGAALGQKPQNTVLKRVTEPLEQAFSVLAPEGWEFVGGAVRLAPPASPGEAAGGLRATIQRARAAQVTLDYTLRSDSTGTVALRRYPDAAYCDASRLPESAGAAGLKSGDTWRGLTVMPLVPAREYITGTLVPRSRPNATSLRVEEQRDLPDLARAEKGRLAALISPVAGTCDAAVVTVTYDENGTTYRERFFDLIVDRGAVAGSQWASRGAMSFRAPAAEFDSRQLIFALMLSSVRESAEWLGRQNRVSLQQGGAAEGLDAKVDELTRQMLEGHAQALVEERDALFPSTTADLEPFANPFTGDVETGTLVLGKYRWESGAGDVVYSANETFNPSVGWTLGRSDWRKCKVQPRGGK